MHKNMYIYTCGVVMDCGISYICTAFPHEPQRIERKVGWVTCSTKGGLGSCLRNLFHLPTGNLTSTLRLIHLEVPSSIADLLSVLRRTDDFGLSMSFTSTCLTHFPLHRTYSSRIDQACSTSTVSPHSSRTSED